MTNPEHSRRAIATQNIVFLLLMLAAAVAGAPLTGSAQQPPGGADSAEPLEESAAEEALLEPGVDPDSEALRVFAAMGRAWAAADTDSLMMHFGRGKVALAFSRGGPRGGVFTRTQASYLFADLFKYSTTEKFEFVKFRNIDQDGQLPYAVADRVFRLDNGVLYRDQVYVSLRREDDTWKVAEIKSIDH